MVCMIKNKASSGLSGPPADEQQPHESTSLADGEGLLAKRDQLLWAFCAFKTSTNAVLKVEGRLCL